MSSFYDDASLVVIPSGYKTSKVYAEKPTDGSGDLTFTRTGDTATRVNSAGLIEKVRTNIILQSETFNNASWSKSDCSITSNTTANPINGALTADTFTLAAGTTQKYAAQLLTINGNFTASVYLKAGTHQFVQFLLGSDSSPIANFDLTNGTASGTNSTASIVSAGNGWYRCSMTFTSSTADGIFILAVDSLAATRFSTTASTGTFIGFGYQLERSDVATAYIPTTTAAVSVGPVANVPRLDYLGSTCPRLLLEPQRTNKITYSENQGPTGTNWYPSTTWTVTNNTVTSPDGYTDADTLTEDTSTGFHSSYFNATIDNSYTGTYTISAFAKYNGRLFVLSPKGSAERTYFNLQTGTVAQAGTGVTASIVNYGNGWYRCICTATFASENVNFEHMLASAVGTLQYTGNGTSGIHIWGCMAEAGAYATSYIPTLGTSVTRVADAASKTGISSLIGQTEGTIFVEEYYDATVANNNGLDDVLVALTDGTTNNLFLILHYGAAAAAYGNVVRFFIRNSNTTQALFDSAALPTGTYKIALAYKNNDVVGYINGVQIGSDTSATIPATSVVTLVDPISLNAATKTVRNSQTLLFKTRLTNAEMASLTSL
jgi:hypothetical protein